MSPEAFPTVGALSEGAAGPVFLHVGTAFVEPTDGHTYDPTDGATTDPYPAVPACPWVATDDPSVLACAMAAVLKRAKAVASTIVVSFMVVSFLVDDLSAFSLALRSILFPIRNDG